LTSTPVPNKQYHGEALAAELPKDIIHKLLISLKKLRVTPRWFWRSICIKIGKGKPCWWPVCGM